MLSLGLGIEESAEAAPADDEDAPPALEEAGPASGDLEDID